VATRRAGVEGTTIHDLRHTAASLLISAGADVKAVQVILGHSTATMTMDLPGHLFSEAAWQAMEQAAGDTADAGATGHRAAGRRSATSLGAPPWRRPGPRAT